VQSQVQVLQLLHELQNGTSTDAGIIHLGTLTFLKRLDLRETRVTSAGLSSFQARLPECTIVHEAGLPHWLPLRHRAWGERSIV
jgi:hypothetical protein